MSAQEEEINPINLGKIGFTDELGNDYRKGLIVIHVLDNGTPFDFWIDDTHNAIEIKKLSTISETKMLDSLIN